MQELNARVSAAQEHIDPCSPRHSLGQLHTGQAGIHTATGHTYIDMVVAILEMNDCITHGSKKQSPLKFAARRRGLRVVRRFVNLDDRLPQPGAAVLGFWG